MWRSIVFCALCSLLHSTSWDYAKVVKQAKNKPDHSKLAGVDLVYVINLDERTEKYTSVCKEFARYGIEPYRFSAVNGWELSYEAIANLGIPYEKGMKEGIMGTYYVQKRNGKLQEKHELISRPGKKYLSHCMSRGAIGIVLSHLSILKDAYDSGYNCIWIMEDDIEILKDIHLVSHLIDEANQLTKKRWDVLYTDSDALHNNGKRTPVYGMAKRPDIFVTASQKKEKVKRQKLSKRFTRLGNRFGAYSYLVSRKGMRKILDYFQAHHLFLPYDMELIFVPELIQLKTNFNFVTTKINSPSDNGAPNYKKSNASY